MFEERKTLFTQRVPGGGRSYFFDVYESEKSGNRYLMLTDSRRVDGEWKRERVLLYPPEARELNEVLDEALTHLI